ncbi:MAG: bifunctional glutamate N-acetyltransferase/amino-acid acetyltransferase ArgJ [Actinobacteria bacterium]|nr:bifunctional glutamate N-acetyltransferase/amino-acid acetyltransferase ArgJ [Actinomycetota bacterium]
MSATFWAASAAFSATARNADRNSVAAPAKVSRPVVGSRRVVVVSDQPLENSSRAPRGFRIVTANLGVKDASTDFCLVVSDRPCTSAGLYTKSRFAGPSVALARAATSSGAARGVVVVSKNANVANGPQGEADALELQQLAGALAGLDGSRLAVASTGVIGRRYPMETMRASIATLALPEAEATMAEFAAAAQAIMTTDTHAKLVNVEIPTIDGATASICGIAKGVGMIEPNMATLLTFFFTDAELSPAALDAAFRAAIDVTFNALSIDTDTSTSDSAAIFANAAAGAVDPAVFGAALREVARRLVLMIAADGEGASKIIEARVSGARDDAQAKLVAKAIVNSPLVKTAVHGSDPNWGRIVMAIGKCDDQTDIHQDRVVIHIGDTEMFPAPTTEAALSAAEAHMSGDHVLIDADLGIADGAFTAYGCDLTDGYIRINADYTT